jgi:hypothetical protein
VATVSIGDPNGDGLHDIAVADGNIATIMFHKPGKPGRFSIPIPVGR